MASREPTYPAHHKALLVQAYNEDDAKFSRKFPKSTIPNEPRLTDVQEKSGPSKQSLQN
jgi:hypothetical protein